MHASLMPIPSLSLEDEVHLLLKHCAEPADFKPYHRKHHLKHDAIRALGQPGFFLTALHQGNTWITHLHHLERNPGRHLQQKSPTLIRHRLSFIAYSDGRAAVRKSKKNHPTLFCKSTAPHTFSLHQAHTDSNSSTLFRQITCSAHILTDAIKAWTHGGPCTSWPAHTLSKGDPRTLVVAWRQRHQSPLASSPAQTPPCPLPAQL